MKTIYLDILNDKGHFICQVPFSYCPAFPIDEKEVNSAIYAKRPSLKDKHFLVRFSNNKVF